MSIDDYQGTPVMNYADTDVPYTRIHEPKHLHPERQVVEKKTLAIREYSHVDDDKPYYPVNSPNDQAMLARYEKLIKQESGRQVRRPAGPVQVFRHASCHRACAEGGPRRTELTGPNQGISPKR